MRKSFLLARSNLRKSKGQTVAIIVLILLAALMLNLWLMLTMDYKQNFDRYHDKLNAEHVTLCVDRYEAKMHDYLSQTLENDERTTEFCLDESMFTTGSIEYNGGEMNTNFVILGKQAALTRSVGKIEITEDSTLTSGIYLPMIYKTGDIEIGKTVEITIGSNVVNYTVCGFFNNIMLGSHNCGTCELVLTEDKYQELEEKGYVPKSMLCSVRITDKFESEDFETMLNNAVSVQYPNAQSSSNSYSLVSQSRYISQMLCSGIVSAMAFFVLLIVLVVISSNIINYIKENMKNLGVLKAVGYTSRQLIGSLLLQFLGIFFVAAVAGVGISYCMFPAVNEMMISQTGIPYAMHFLPIPLLIVFVILGGMVTLAVWLSARRIKKIEPIVALRQGVQTHNFQRNYFSLEKTKAPLNLALALKTTFSGIKQNITVGITMLVLSLVVVFSGLMTENVIVDMTPVLNLIVGEISDSCININAEIEEEFLQEINSNELIEKIYLYDSHEVWHVGGVGLMATLSDDFSKVNNQDVCIEGRFPKYDNEVVIAVKYARESELQVGNEIVLTAGGKEEKYIISGFTQISNNLGKDCLLTRAGYERLSNLDNLSYYLNLAEGVNINEFNEEVRAQFNGKVNSVINLLSVIEGAGMVYVSLMTIIVVAIFILSIIIIAFVLYLLVRTMLNNKKRDYGIMKALGFTTGQLILQTAISFMPSVILSMTLGLIICTFFINPLTAVFLSGVGIVKCTFAIPIGFIAVSGIGLILFAFGIACLLSLKVKKISPIELLAGE